MCFDKTERPSACHVITLGRAVQRLRVGRPDDLPAQRAGSTSWLRLAAPRDCELIAFYAVGHNSAADDLSVCNTRRVKILGPRWVDHPHRPRQVPLGNLPGPIRRASCQSAVFATRDPVTKKKIHHRNLRKGRLF